MKLDDHFGRKIYNINLSLIQINKMIRNLCKPFRLIKTERVGVNLNSNKVDKWQDYGALCHSNNFKLIKPLLGNQIKYLFSSDKKADNFKKKMSKQEMFKAQEQQLMKQTPDESPTSYDKASSSGGKIFMGIGVLSLAGLIVWVEFKRRSQQSELDQSISGMIGIKQEKKVKIGGQWTLIDHKGQPFSSTDLAGSYYLIYFGFTKCPDICPATLIKLGRVLRLIRKMPQYHYMNLKAVFVSCDPDRDTPKRLTEYLKNFDDQIIGVTGISNEDPELKNCMKSFKIYASKIPLENENYSMDHTTITYIMDDENKYVDHLNPTLTEQQMAKTVVNRILDNDYHKMQRRKQKDASKK